VTVDIDASLSQILESYLKSWGPVQWRHVEELQLGPHPELGTMLFGLALIEADSLVIRKKLATSRADRRQALLDFITVWLAEEAEHSRALGSLARSCGITAISYEKRSITRDPRAAIAWPALMAASLLPGLSAAYCTLGTAQELVALTTYNYLAKEIPDQSAAAVLRAIARQEGRHMRFYRRSAEVLLADSPAAQRATSVLLGRLWRPPGMDLLGPRSYHDIFRPILTDPRYCGQLLEVDQVLQRLPGLNGISVMAPFLTRSGYDTSPALARAS
jgi:hypothetical protein